MLKQLFWPVYAPSLLFQTGMGATVPVYVLAALDVGATPSVASAIVSVMGLVALVLAIPAGMFIDRVGDRQAMLIATLADAAVTAVTVFALTLGAGPVSLWLYAITLVLRAPSEGVWQLARQSFVASTVPPTHTGLAMTALGGTLRVGQLLGPLCGAGLVLFLPLWSVFVFSVLCGLAAVGILYAPALGGRSFSLAEAGAPSRNKAPQVTETSAKADDTGTRAATRVNWTAVTLVGVPIFILMSARIVQPVVVQLWGNEHQLTSSMVSLLIAVGAAVELVIMIPSGYAKDRFGRAATLIVCMAVYGVGFLLLVWQAGVAGAMVAVVIMALGNGLGAGINMTIGADLSPSEHRARFFGVWSLFSATGRVGGPFAISAFVTFATLSAGMLSVAGALLAGAAWMMVFARAVGLPRGRGRG